MKVLVAGGSGFVGKALQKVRPDWVYISSKDYDLTNEYQARGMIRDHRHLDAVIHLAGKVGGVKDNQTKQAEYIHQNLMINTNLIHEAYKEGVPRVLSSLSTCAFPDEVQAYPFDEDDLHLGPPARSNLSYGYAKRVLKVMSDAYREQYGLNYSTFTPSNLYGPYDNFDLESSHFVAAMVRKFYEAKEGETIEFWGTGRPMRQQLFVDDLAKIIPKLLELHNSSIPLIVAPSENLSIKEMIEMCNNFVGKHNSVKFNGALDGQQRKDGSNKALLDLIGRFEFTPFATGAEATYRWYGENE
jgi:GDP-L-fucose synthase